MSKIIILSSAQQELQPFLSRLSGLEQVCVHGMTFHVGQHLNHELCLGLTGVGMVNAAMTSAVAVEAFKPDLLMFSGVAGGMQPQVKIGDVVIVTEAAQPEMFTVNAAVAGTPFTECMINPHKKLLPPEWYVSASIPNNICADDFVIHYGRGVSSDQFPAPQIEYPMLLKENVLAIDMETAAMYHVGWLMGVDTIGIRGISNVLQSDGSDPDMATADVDKAPERAAEVTLQLLASL